MKKLITLTIGMFLIFSAYGQSKKFPSEFTKASVMTVDDTLLIQQDSAQWVTVDSLIKVLERNIDVTALATGTASSSTYLRGDGAWATPAGSGDALTTNGLDQFASTTSAELAGVISNETGSGALVFGTSPTFTTDITIGSNTITEADAGYLNTVSENVQDAITALRASDEDTTVLVWGTGLTATGDGNDEDSTIISVTTEDIQDLIGAMVTGNTETNITVSYQDADGTLDFVANAGGSGGYSVLRFEVDSTVNAPSPGDSLVTHGSLFEKYIEVYRSTQWGDLTMQRNRDSLGYELSDSTLTLHPVLASKDYVEVHVYDSTDITTIALRDTATAASGRVSVATDDFTYADAEVLASHGWTDNLGYFTIASNETYGGQSSTYNVCSIDGTFADDQYAEAEITTTTASTSNSRGVSVRCSGSEGTANCYSFYVDLDGGWRLWKYVNGTYSSMVNGTGETFNEGDIIALEVVGNTLTMKINDVVFNSPQTDSDLTSGNPGVCTYSNNVSTLDNFDGGNIE